MEILLAAAAALVYGVGDYCGGRASRKIDSLVGTCSGQVFSLMLLGVFLAVLGDPTPGLHDWLWGAAGGVGVAIRLAATPVARRRHFTSAFHPAGGSIGVQQPVGVQSAQRHVACKTLVWVPRARKKKRVSPGSGEREGRVA